MNVIVMGSGRVGARVASILDDGQTFHDSRTPAQRTS